MRNQPQAQAKVVQKYVKIQSLIDSRLVYTGRISGELYEWQRAGDIIAVKEEDVPELLSKRIGERSCCGEGLLGNRIFEEIIGGN